MSPYTLMLLLAVAGCAVASSDYRNSDLYNYYFKRYERLHRYPTGSQRPRYNHYDNDGYRPKNTGYSSSDSGYSSKDSGYSSHSSDKGYQTTSYNKGYQPRKHYFGNGNDNGNCDGNCEDNNSGNNNGNKNINSYDNGNGNGNCRGNCFNNENGNGNGNKNKGVVGNGNNNGNCVGNCYHNKLGNDNGNGNSKKGNQGNNKGNCFGNCFHLTDGNGKGNYDCGDYYYCGHYDHRRGRNCEGNCISYAPDLYVNLDKLPRSYSGDLTCTDHGGDTYHIYPDTNCNGIYRRYKTGGSEKFSCGMKATFDLSICACNHWYFNDYQKTCKSGMKRKESKEH